MHWPVRAVHAMSPAQATGHTLAGPGGTVCTPSRTALPLWCTGRCASRCAARQRPPPPSGRRAGPPAVLPVKHGRVQVIVAASAACGLRLRSVEKRETGFWRSANSPTQRFRFSKTYFPAECQQARVRAEHEASRARAEREPSKSSRARARAEVRILQGSES